MGDEERNIMKRMKLAVYGHGGSFNHGNEAIVRGVCEIFPEAEVKCYTFSVAVDKHFGLDEMCELRPMTQNVNISYGFRMRRKLFGYNRRLKEEYYREYFRPFIEEIDPETIYLLEAGDQYCEPGDHRMFYAMLNREIRRRGAKSVMLGCTVNPELLEDMRTVEDIKNYSLVIARESITYNALKERISGNVYLAPCPAFAMKNETVDIPESISKILRRGGGSSVLMRDSYSRATKYIMIS